MARRTIKGTSVQLTVDLVRERHGDEGVTAMVEALPGPMREQLPVDLKFLPSTTWPFELWAELLLSAETVFGHIARESSRVGYGKLLETTYASWVREGDPAGAVRRLPLLWQQVTQGLGEYTVLDGPNLVIRVRLQGVPARYREITEERVAGTIEAMITACGSTGTVTRTVIGLESEYLVGID